MDGKRRIGLGLAAVAAAAVLWFLIRGSPPDRPAASDPATASQTNALLRIAVSRRGAPAGDREAMWLAGELRYLLTRSRVALAQPQGPFAPDATSPVFTLRVAVGTGFSEPAQLDLVDPRGQIVKTASVTPPKANRLGQLSAIGAALDDFLPRGATGIDPTRYLGSDDPDAYEALARAQLSATGGLIAQTTLTSRDTPLDRLEQLVRDYPRVARAHAELAMTLLAIDGRDAASLTVSADRAARQALATDPELALAHAALGIALQRQGQWAQADESLTQALSLDPALRPALDAFGCLLVDTGRLRYARLMADQAEVVDGPRSRTGSCLDFTNAESGRQHGGPHDAASTPLAALRALLADDADAVREAISGHGAAARVDWVAPVLRARQDPRQRPAAIRAVTQAASAGELDPALEIVAGLALGQVDFVLNRLQRLKTQGREVPTRFLWIAEASLLRESSRFPQLLTDLGLVGYWEKRGLPDACDGAGTPAWCPQVEPRP